MEKLMSVSSRRLLIARVVRGYLAGVLPRLLEALHSAGILTEDLAITEDLYDLEATYRGLCRLPDVPNSKRRRIDFLAVPWEARGAALLYYTVRASLLPPAGHC